MRCFFFLIFVLEVVGSRREGRGMGETDREREGLKATTRRGQKLFVQLAFLRSEERGSKRRDTATLTNSPASCDPFRRVYGGRRKAEKKINEPKRKSLPPSSEPTLHLPSPTTHPTLLPLHLLRPCLSLTKPGKFLLPSYTPSRRFSDLAPGSRKGEGEERGKEGAIDSS